MKKLLMMVIMSVMLTAPTICAASGWHDAQDSIGVDKFAHAACSYVICDQLQHAGMNRFWASATTLALGAVKEQWIDDHWDSGDFAADCAGVLMYEIKF